MDGIANKKTLITTVADELPSPQSTIIDSDRVVFGSCAFGSWEWDLRSQAKIKSHVTNYYINWVNLFGEEYCFGDLSGVVISIMEYTFARLKDPIECESAVNVMTAKNNIRDSKRILDWMDASGFGSFSELDRYDIENLIDWLRVKHLNGELSAERVSKSLGFLKMYFNYTKRVSDPLSFNPFTGSASKQIGNSTSGEENKTPVIPFEVMSPLIRNTLNMVAVYSDDILNARKHIFEVRDEAVEKARKKKADIAKSGLSRLVKKEMDNLLPTLPISDNPDTGKPWRKPWTKYEQWQTDERQLYNACMCVIFFLSGMRSSEVETIPVGGAKPDISHDGVTQQFKIRGKLIKHDDKDEAWVVIEPAYVAIKLAERIAKPLRDEVGTDLVFFTVKGTNKSSFVGPLVIDADMTTQRKIELHAAKYELTCDDYGAGKGATNYRLAGLIPYINSVIEHDDDDGKLIPDVNGKVWGLTSRQFRRTLARYIARQPFGIIAGMIQYKHAHTAIFEGYAGKDPEWNRMLEEERVMASVDHMKDLYFDLQDGAVAGAKGEELLDDYEQMFADFKGVAGDRRKDGLDYWLNHTKANLYVGKLNYCFFNSDTAMCNRSDATEKREHPVLNRCHPDECANSCVTNKHVPIWQAQVDDANDLLSCDGISDPQRITLERERDMALEIIERVKKKEGNE